MHNNFLKETNRIYSSKVLKGVFLLLLLWLMLPIYPQENVNFTKISELEDYATSYNDVAIKGQYAYCVGNINLDIIDISNPASPFKVGSYKTYSENSYSDYFEDIQLLDNRGYIRSENGLSIFNISDPANPTYLGDIKFGNYSIFSFYISNQFAFLGSYGTIYVVDISDPTNPSTITSFDTVGDINCISASKDYLFAAVKYSNIVLIIDISNPTDPIQVSEISCSSPEAIYISGTYAYIGNGDGFSIYDISSPQSPVKIGAYNDNNYEEYNNIFVSNSLAYLQGKEIINIIDISTPSNPISKNRYNYSGFINKCISSENTLYSADNRGLRIVDVTDVNKPSFISSFENYGRINSMKANGKYLYLGKEYGLQVVDISRPDSPSWLNAISTDDCIEEMLVHKNYLYAIIGINNDKYFRIYDLSDPSHPVNIGEAPLPNHDSPVSEYMKPLGDYVYIGGFYLIVFDISNPSSPIQTAQLNKISSDLAIYGGYAYLVTGIEDITILDISSPASPGVLNTFNIGSSGLDGALTIALKDKIAYIGGFKGIALYDLSNPTAPELTKKYSTQYSVYSIKTNDNTASIHTTYVFEYADLSDPSNPETSGYISEDPTIEHADQNNYVFLGNLGGWENKIAIFEYAPTQSISKISLDRNKLYFGAVAGISNLYPQTVHVNCSGNIPVAWRLSSDEEWIDYWPLGGFGSAEFEVFFNDFFMHTEIPGIYSGSMYVNNLQSIFNAQTIDVEVQLYDPSNTTVPFGEMATPNTNSVVSGSIPVTGWALDDIGIESVKIFLQQGNTQTPIGDAIFVEGARPDIEQTFPTYPNAYKAGWGYMLLTHFLPNNGNGTFTLVASATDHEGNTVILGSKTITCDNAHAVKPFGAIDTPTQGGTASGDSFNHWGWVLTPQPNTIPIDGSTINVYIDGVLQGHPTYNIFRSDIADYFPGYNNSNGAIGHFNLDTTQFSNGVHTIYWTAKDNAGNSDGIGSRYFSITNPNSSQNVNAINSRYSSNGLTVFGNKYTNQQQFPPLHQIAINGESPLVISKNAPLEDQPETIAANENGNYLIMAKEMDRIEILFPEDSQLIAGFSMLGMNKRSLPIGSTLDTGENKFSWSIGLGFIGQYHLTFIEKTKNGDYQKKFITVMIEHF